MPSIREKFLGATKRRYRKSRFVVDGEVVEIGLRSLTEGERTAFEMVRAGAKNETDVKSAEASLRRRLIVLMAMELDDKGNVTDTPVFSFDDIIAMEGVDCGVTCPVYNDALEHAFITQADIEELAKNSVGTAGDSSQAKSA